MTDRASFLVAIFVIVARAVTAIAHPAITANIAGDCDSQVQRSVRAWIVLDGRGNRQPGLAENVSADAEVGGSPVAHVRTISVPDASILKRNTLIVDVVLSGSRAAVPLEVTACVGTSEGTCAMRFCIQRNDFILCTYSDRSVFSAERSFGLQTRIICTTNGDIGGQLVLDCGCSCPFNAEIL